MEPKSNFINRFSGDFKGGLSAMLVAVPSTIAYGIMSFAPLGPKFSSMAAVGAVMGTIIFSIVTPFFGGTKGLVSAPSAPAAAVLSVFVVELMGKDKIPIEIIPVYVTFLTIFSGLMQFLIGNFGGGKFIKYIPFPVISGYLSGISILILIGQIPKLLGLPKGLKWFAGIIQVQSWRWESVCIGTVTIIAMILAKKYIKKTPSVIVALFAGIVTYFLIGILVNPAMLTLENNPMVIGDFPATATDMMGNIARRWSLFPSLNFELLGDVLVPGITLALLLSVTTLNTCVIIDTKTHSSHNPRRELMSQGIGNMLSALFCGIPSAGLITATTENINNGGKSKYSTVISGVITLITLLLAGKFLSWLPLAALAGILIMVAIRMLDFKVFGMLRNRSTVFDFIVIITVVISAANLDLIKAAGVGIAMAILLFLREQMGISVIRRKLFGNQVFSKKIRLSHERTILEEKGGKTLIIEIQGQLFFGTTDQLYSKLEDYYDTCKYIMLDMRRIQSIDYTAANMLKKILARVKDKNGFLIFTSIPQVLPTGQNLMKYFENLGLFDNHHLKVYESTEDALEWVEDEILKAENLNANDDDHVFELHEIELFENFSKEAIETFKSCLVVKSFKEHELIFKAGDISDEIYFVRKGTVKIVLPLSDTKVYHLLTIGRGGVFGEMAFIDNVRRSADALPLEELSLYVLSRDKFEEVTAVHPEIAGIFYQRLALLTVKRLRQSNKELKVFQEN